MSSIISSRSTVAVAKMAARETILNVLESDKKTVEYLSQRGATNPSIFHGDEDADYSKVFEYEASELEPTVAKPFSPDNITVARDLSSTELDKSYIGSCTGAKYEDLLAAAKILKGRQVKIRTEVLPAAISIYKKAIKDGLIEIFLNAGATVGPPTCGACCGAHMGVLAKDEICVSTTNRNFPGRMGHVESQTYLASPQVAAASAVTGKLTDPRDLN